jgi:FMN phosphatase YigB (HAD superfamily)
MDATKIKMDYDKTFLNPANIDCIVFDFGFTLSSDLYFKTAPPECPDWQELIQQNIFSNNALVDSWMAGAVTIHDIAEELAPIVNMQVPRIVNFMELGCQKLDFNNAVLDFAIRQRQAGRKTAIVTGNMDVFTKIVVPFHHLNDRFDVIINSFDYREIDKTVLWAKAFELLGNKAGYAKSLLIEDGAKNVRKFREHGGHAYQYENDSRFLSWLEYINWC